MVYNDLDKIPLCKFIEVFMGNISCLDTDSGHEDSEIKETADRLINKYLSIVGGKVLQSEISKKNELLNLGIKMDCMDACDNLVKIGDWHSVCSILGLFGYKLFANQKDMVRKRIDSVRASAKYRMSKMEVSAKEDVGAKMDRDYFTRERVMVMKHYKMHIDPNIFTAGEYAYMVKGMCEEIERMSKK